MPRDRHGREPAPACSGRDYRPSSSSDFTLSCTDARPLGQPATYRPRRAAHADARVRGPFDYRLRPEQSDVGVGSLLRVKFNHRTTLGVVLELATESELAPERLAEPDAVLPPGVPADLVDSRAGSRGSIARRPRGH